MLDNFARRVRARLDEARGASQQEALRQLLVQQELDRLRALPCHSDPRCLVRFGAKVYSQNDEDGILAEVFRRIGTTNQRFVEIGVEAGLENNTLALLFQGWSGVWVEGHPPYVNQIRKGFQRTIDSGALQVLEAYVNRETVDALIAGACDVPEIDLLSLDIDGNDLHVFEAIQCVRPRVVVMEYNAKFPPPIEYGLVYDPDYLWEGDDCFGASLTTLEARMRDRTKTLESRMNTRADEDVKRITEVLQQLAETIRTELGEADGRGVDRVQGSQRVDERLAGAPALRLAEEPGLQPRQVVRHRIGSEIPVGQRDRRDVAIVALEIALGHV